MGSECEFQLNFTNTRVYRFDCSSNKLKNLPSSLGNCPNLSDLKVRLWNALCFETCTQCDLDVLFVNPLTKFFYQPIQMMCCSSVLFCLYHLEDKCISCQLYEYQACRPSYITNVFFSSLSVKHHFVTWFIPLVHTTCLERMDYVKRIGICGIQNGIEPGLATRLVVENGTEFN